MCFDFMNMAGKRNFRAMAFIWASAVFILVSAAATYGHEPFEMRIEDRHGGTQGSYDSISVTKVSGPDDIYSFDLTVGVNAEALTVYGVSPGELFSMPGAYEWEYFNFRLHSIYHNDASLPVQAVRVRGISDLNDGAHQPVATTVPDGTVLFYINVQVTLSIDYECLYVPVDFIWTDCRSNVIKASDTAEEFLAISDHIFDHLGNDITSPTGTFPSAYGAFDECLDSLSGSNPQRLIDFYGGGIDLVCWGKLLFSGDPNLNDMYYDIGDIILFDNYFMYGMGVFTFVPGLQIEQTDMDNDGRPLTVKDYWLLMRHVEGILTPF